MNAIGEILHADICSCVYKWTTAGLPNGRCCLTVFSFSMLSGAFACAWCLCWHRDFENQPLLLFLSLQTLQSACCILHPVYVQLNS